jgi:hypothetical protein
MGTSNHTVIEVRETHVAPALDPLAPYSSRLSARSALYTDLQLLLDDRQEALPPEGYRKMVVDENCLARSSNSARRKLWEELRKRYLLDREHPLFLAFWQEWRRCKSEPERGLTAYLLLALNDRLVADLGFNWLYGHLRKAPEDLRVDDVRIFIRHAAETDHPEIQTWTEDTRLHVAQHYMASIRDFGLAHGKVRKTSNRPALYGAPIRLLIRALRLARMGDFEIVTAAVFRLLALEGTEVIDALGELNRQGELRFRIQADVIELEIGGTE